MKDTYYYKIKTSKLCQDCNLSMQNIELTLSDMGRGIKHKKYNYRIMGDEIPGKFEMNPSNVKEVMTTLIYRHMDGWTGWFTVGEPNRQDETQVLNSKTMQLQSLHIQTKLRTSFEWSAEPNATITQAIGIKCDIKKYIVTLWIGETLTTK